MALNMLQKLIICHWQSIKSIRESKETIRNQDKKEKALGIMIKKNRLVRTPYNQLAGSTYHRKRQTKDLGAILMPIRRTIIARHKRS